MAFRGSFVTMAKYARNDVAPHLKNMWKHYNKVNGEVTQSLSPYEVKIVQPFFDHAFQKLITRFTIYFKAYGIQFISGVAMVSYLKGVNHAHHFHERS